GYQFPKLKRRLPKKYWVGKIEGNIKRDRTNRVKLREASWEVLRVWEHEIQKDLDQAVNKIITFLKNCG
ncbi:MAG: DUF559 domain-containing protein, partial [Patescibacteria group bacterium]